MGMYILILIFYLFFFKIFFLQFRTFFFIPRFFCLFHFGCGGVKTSIQTLDIVADKFSQIEKSLDEVTKPEVNREFPQKSKKLEGQTQKTLRTSNATRTKMAEVEQLNLSNGKNNNKKSPRNSKSPRNNNNKNNNENIEKKATKVQRSTSKSGIPLYVVLVKPVFLS